MKKFLPLSALLIFFLLPQPTYAVEEVCAGNPPDASCCTAPAIIENVGGCPAGTVWIGDAATGQCTTPNVCNGSHNSFHCETNTCYAPPPAAVCSTANVTTGTGLPCCADNEIAVRDANAPTGWICSPQLSSPWTLSGSDIYYNAGNVGINTTTPQTLFHILQDGLGFANGFLLQNPAQDNSFYLWATNDTVHVNATDSLTITAGNLDTLYVEQLKVGIGTDTPGASLDVYSWNVPAMEIGNADATNERSVAWGNLSVASGVDSFAQGRQTTASGQDAVAFNFDTTASGADSAAFGASSEAQGYNSAAFGIGTVSYNSGSVAVGRYNDFTKPVEASHIATLNPEDLLFMVGDGTSDAARSTAMAVTSGGRVGIGTNGPLTPLHVIGSARFGTTFVGAAIGGDSFAAGFRTRAESDRATAFGYETLASGAASTAMGTSTIASGDTSTAMGWSTEATNNDATAMGSDTLASGAASTAMGTSTQATGTSATAMGHNTQASNNYATAMGRDTIASGLNSTAIGWGVTASGNDASIAMGRGMTVSGNNSVGIGLSNAAETLSDSNTMAIMGGEVGIGRVNPRTPLEVVGAIRSSEPAGSCSANPLACYGDFYHGGSAGLIINSQTGGTWADIAFQSNGITRMFMNYNGDFGIGTTSPDVLLDLGGTADASGVTGTGVLEIGNALRFDPNEIITNTNTALYLQNGNNGDFYVDGGTLFVDASSNEVGIGTSSPAQKLHVNGNIRSSVGFNGIGGHGSSYAHFSHVNLTGAGQYALLQSSGGTTYLNSVGTGNIYIRNDNVTNMTIEDGGNVGIGTTSPSGKLHVLGSDGNYGIMGGGYYSVIGEGDGAGGFFADRDTGVYAVLGQNSYGLQANGSINIFGGGVNAWKPGGGSWVANSDVRLKDVKGDYDRGLAEILELRPVEYSYKADNPLKLPSDETYIGFIAQEVREVFPESVFKGDDGYLSLDKNPIDVAVINAIQELKAQNESLKSVVCELKPDAEVCNQ